MCKGFGKCDRKWGVSYTYEDILLVLVLDGSDDSGSDHGLFPRLGEVQVEDALLVALVNVRFHLLGHVLRTNVHLNTSTQIDTQN